MSPYSEPQTSYVTRVDISVCVTAYLAVGSEPCAIKLLNFTYTYGLEAKVCYSFLV